MRREGICVDYAASELEPGSESEKLYCPGVGLVMDNDAFLVDFTRGHHDDDDDDDDDGNDD